MNQNMIEKDDDETAQIFMGEDEMRCPFCNYIIIVDKDTKLEDVVCPECNSRPSEFNAQKDSRFGGSA